MGNSKKAEQKQQKNIQQPEEFFDKADSISSKCPNCEHTVLSLADICENCGEWLLLGKCNFCYADVEEGQKFCGECGNSPEGVVCKSCGNLSHFDFCKHCNIPLTEQANEIIEIITNSSQYKNILELNTLDSDMNETSSFLHELQKMKEYAEKADKSKPAKKAFSLSNNQKKIEDNIKAIEQSKQLLKKEEERQKEEEKKELDALKYLEEIKQKNFENNQESRRFFGALKILVPTLIEKKVQKIKKIPVPYGWRCNAYHVIHHEGPQGCGSPNKGGEWIFSNNYETKIIEETILEKDIKEIEL